MKSSEQTRVMRKEAIAHYCRILKISGSRGENVSRSTTAQTVLEVFQQCKLGVVSQKVFSHNEKRIPLSESQLPGNILAGSPGGTFQSSPSEPSHLIL